MLKRWMLFNQDGGGAGAGGGAAGAGGNSADGGGDAGGSGGDGAAGGAEGQGGNLPGFMQNFPEAIRGHEAFKGIESMEAVGQKFISSQARIAELEAKTGSTIEIPGDDATPEAKQAFRAKLGVPDSVDGYEIPRPTLYEGMAYDETMEKSMLGVFHEAGVSTLAARKIFDAYNKHQLAQYEGQQAASEKKVQEAEATLRQPEHFGAEYDAKVNRANAVAKTLGLTAGLEKEGLVGALYSSPTLIKTLESISDLILDGTGAPIRTGAGGKEKNMVHGKHAPSYKTQ
jgi:hypothetical protein